MKECLQPGGSRFRARHGNDARDSGSCCLFGTGALYRGATTSFQDI